MISIIIDIPLFDDDLSMIGTSLLGILLGRYDSVQTSHGLNLVEFRQTSGILRTRSICFPKNRPEFTRLVLFLGESTLEIPKFFFVVRNGLWEHLRWKRLSLVVKPEVDFPMNQGRPKFAETSGAAR